LPRNLTRMQILAVAVAIFAVAAFGIGQAAGFPAPSGSP
jgi:hypothetical protein